MEHFTSASHKRAVERLEGFKQKESHVDVKISSAAKQQLAQEEQERLQNRKVINRLRNKFEMYTVMMTDGSINLPVTTEFLPVILSYSYLRSSFA